MIFKKILTLGVLMSLSLTVSSFTDKKSQHPEEALKAVIEMGSGRFNLLVGSCDLDGKLKITGVKSEKVPVATHLSKIEGKWILNENIVVPAMLQSLKSLQKEAIKLGGSNIEIRAIATEAFRKAENQSKILKIMTEETGLEFTVISEEVESAIGFKSVLGAYKAHKIVVLEVGSGSIQLSFEQDDQFHALSLPLGTVPTISLLWEKVRNNTIDKMKPSNPISKEEVQLLNAEIADQLEMAYRSNAIFFKMMSEKLNNGAQLVGIGLAGLVGTAIKKWESSDQVFKSEEVINVKELNDFAEYLIMYPDTKLEGLWPESAASGITLLHALADYVGVKTIDLLDVPAGAGAFQYLYSSKKDE